VETPGGFRGETISQGSVGTGTGKRADEVGNPMRGRRSRAGLFFGTGPGESGYSGC
jgi:hypothetical protein